MNNETSIFDEIPGTFAAAFKDAPAAVIYDRSDLQRWAECPQQAWLLAKHKTNAVGEPAITGDEVHKVVSMAMRARQVDADVPSEVKDCLIGNAAFVRPDVQPQTVAVLRKSAWLITQTLCFRANGQPRHPDDLIVYDGGEGDRSGQLSWEVIPGTDKTASVIVTSELDLLLATDSAEEVEDVDYKSGWRTWTAGDVKIAFQFQLHAVLVFENYPAVQRVTIRILNLRDADSTSPVVFRREDMEPIRQRVRSAVKIAQEYRHAAEPPPAWPMIDKCELCPVASHCEYARTVPDSLLATDPAEYLRVYAVTSANAERMKGRLSLKVRSEGKDFAADGLAFGTEKPKATRAKTCDLYDAPKAGAE